METGYFDIEVRQLATFNDTEQFMFIPRTSAGQDWLEDELGLRGTGQPVQRMTVTGKQLRDEIVTRMRQDGLEVASLVHGGQ